MTRDRNHPQPVKQLKPLALRYNRQAVDETPPSDAQWPERRKSLAEISYAVIIGLLMIDAIEFDASWPGLGWWIAITVILALGYLGAFVFTTSKPRPLGEIPTNIWEITTTTTQALKTAITARRGTKMLQLRKWLHQRAKWLYQHGDRLLLVLTTVAMTVLTITCGVNDWYVGQLGIASATMLLIIGSAILQPTLTARRSRKRYWDGLKAVATQPPAYPVQPQPKS